MKSMHELGVSIPAHKNLVVRNLQSTTQAQREEILRRTEHNVFHFPAKFVLVDYLSDSGTSAMFDTQWAALLHGDESYGRNTGYFCLLEAIRDTFERGDQPRHAIDLLLTGEKDSATLMQELFLGEVEGGLVNGGVYQLTRPNTFIVPQGRCAEYLLFATLRTVLDKHFPDREFYIPSNGHFDTTEANIHTAGLHPLNLFRDDIFADFPVTHIATANPFKGDMDITKLEEVIADKGVDAIPLIYLTITNNTAAGQPVSLGNIKQVSAIAKQHGIPLFFDACRFAENAWFIQQFEAGYKDKSIRSIIQEMFSYADGFSISFKKDGLANMGGGLFFRDQGVFHQRFSLDFDIGILLKERQILTFGNDSYGGMSGRDIMALTVGLYEIVDDNYLRGRIEQVRNFAIGLARAGLPAILPPGGHAVYLDMDKFFGGTDTKLDDFRGVGFTLELLRYYGIRACELGPFAFEWDQKTEEARKGILNLVRFAVPRQVYSKEHIDYTIAAVSELYQHRDQIPCVEIVRGKELRLRHFQSGLKPIY
jgi:tryptophanase